MLEEIASAFNTETGLGHIALRLIAASLFGFILGFEREFHRRPAGLRTHMLTALAAAVFALIAFEMIAQLPNQENVRLDAIRVVEAVTAGVAFLAAGTIIYAKGAVHGLTTGAGMWLSGAVGLACGAGYLAIGAMATWLGLCILLPLRIMETKFPRQETAMGGDYDD